MKITNTDSHSIGKLKILIYGESGNGKTTLAGTLNESTLIISAEAGLLSLASKKIDVVDITTNDLGEVIPKEKRIARLVEIYQYLLTEEPRKKYKWLFIDSLTEISQNLIEALYAEFPDRKDSLVMYGENSKRIRAIVKSFRDLPFYNVVFTALAETDKDENNQRFLNISMVGNFASKISGFFDEVFYLGTIANANGDIERKLITAKTDKIIAKDRSGRLEKMEPPDLGAISKKIYRPVIEIKKTEAKVLPTNTEKK